MLDYWVKIRKVTESQIIKNVCVDVRLESML